MKPFFKETAILLVGMGVGLVASPAFAKNIGDVVQERAQRSIQTNTSAAVSGAIDGLFKAGKTVVVEAIKSSNQGQANDPKDARQSNQAGSIPVSAGRQKSGGPAGAQLPVSSVGSAMQVALEMSEIDVAAINSIPQRQQGKDAGLANKMVANAYEKLIKAQGLLDSAISSGDTAAVLAAQKNMNQVLRSTPVVAAGLKAQGYSTASFRDAIAEVAQEASESLEKFKAQAVRGHAQRLERALRDTPAAGQDFNSPTI